MNKKYFALEKAGQTATLNIYGDITSFPWFDGDTSAANLSRQLEEMGDVSQIDVFINSYGGEVAEGLAIYNALRRHKAKVVTHCDGFACSIASVIFMAGDERIMCDSSLLMIHNAWTYVSGNADALRKQAEDLDKITQASIEAYKAHSSLSESEIRSMMDAETWILPAEALSFGFATGIERITTENASQNALSRLFEIVKQHKETAEDANNVDPDNGEPETAEPAEPGEPETESPKTDEPENDVPEDGENESEKPAQYWSGFFNAILEM